MRIELVIDELVLHGFDARHKHAVGDAVQQQLAHALGQPTFDLGALGPIDSERTDAGSFNVRAGASVEALGAGIAQSVLSVVKAGGV
ncbi:MAG: hypothetical protein ABMA15_01565 [Vicinamibacterales bacterium]